jgi:peroxiredoxin
MTTTVAPTARPAAGAPAPDFSLPSTSGASVSLSDFRGRQPVLIAFFPLAFTSTCTAEMCAFRDDYHAFVERGVMVLPISVDSTATLKEFKAKHELRTDLLSDFRREVSRAYGVLVEERFHSTRAYFLVDAEGIVRWAHVEPNPGQRRENAEILAEVAKL